MANVRGRGKPPKFESAEQMQAKVDDYFATMDEQGRPYTMAGLALHLGCDRQTLINYKNKNDEYFDTYKKARDRVHAFVEEQLFRGNAAGTIFSLKNNFGWEDKQTVDASLTVKLVDYAGNNTSS